jgi:hypothetical protein
MGGLLMPVDQDLMQLAMQAAATTDVVETDDNLLSMARMALKQDEPRRRFLYNRYARDIAGPVRAVRLKAIGNAIEELSDPVDRRLLVEEVSKATRKRSDAEIERWRSGNFGSRFLTGISKTNEAFVDGTTGVLEAAKGLVTLPKAKGDIDFASALEAAQMEGMDREVKERGLAGEAATGLAGMAPDLVGGMAAFQAGGPAGMWGYWSARLFPEQREEFISMGMTPEAATIAGAGTAMASAGIELIQVDPTGVMRNVSRPAKAAALRAVSRHPLARRALTGALGTLRRFGLELAEEPAQAAVEASARAAVSDLYPELEGRDWADVPAEAKAVARAAAPGLAAMTLIGGAGRYASQLRRFQRLAEGSRETRRQAEMFDYRNRGVTPTRKKWADWGLTHVGHLTKKARAEKLHEIVNATQEVNEISHLGHEIIPTDKQWAQFGYSEKEAATPLKRMDFLAAKHFGPPGTLDKAEPETAQPKPGQSPTSAIEEAQAEADAMQERRAGFLAEETGARPLEGQLGDPEIIDQIASGKDVSLDSGDPEFDRRRRKAHGLQKPGALEEIKAKLKRTWHSITRSHVYLPNTDEYAHARETLRLLKGVPAASLDEAIRVTGSVTKGMGPKKLELLEDSLIANNQLRSLRLNQPLRFGAKSKGFVENWKAKLDAMVESTPDVADALNRRGKITREVATKMVEQDLLPESVLEDPENYFHQQVLTIQEGKRRAGLRPKKRSFQRQRVEGEELGEEYDYNTSYVESEIEWLSDAFEESRKQGLLAGLMERYDETGRLNKILEQFGDAAPSLADLVKKNPNLTFWQPRPGNLFYKAVSIPEKLAEQLQMGLVQEANISKDVLREVLAVGGKRKSYVIPTELADQLDLLEKPKPKHWVGQLSSQLLKKWKQWVLLAPHRIVPYSVRNITGDMDPVFAADPTIMKNVPRAVKELLGYHFGSTGLSRAMKSARDLSVTTSGFATEEVSEAPEARLFRNLTPEEKKSILKNPVKAYMEYVKPFTDMRENTLRYAAFLTYKDQIEKGQLNHYGGAKRSTVETLSKEMGTDVAAAHMARELLGDYGNLTEAGQWIREHLMPFWSFQEINLKRWPRLLINAISSGQGRGRSAAILGAAATLRLGGMYTALWVFNNLIYPLMTGSDDEDKLTDNDKANPHILLGPNPDGTVKLFRNVGALGDFLEWFGLNEAIASFDELSAGQADVGDIMKEMGMGFGEKLIGSVRPEVKSGFEITTGQSLFPSPFSPRSVERDVAVANIAGLSDPYKWFKGKAIGKGNRARRHAWWRAFVGIADPRANALGEMYDLRRRFLARKGATGGGVYPISEYKQARDAAIAEDYEAFAEWHKSFIEKHKGKSYRKFKAFIGRLDPIASRLNDQEEAEFANRFLSADQRGKLQVARDYSQELRVILMIWWIAASQDEKVPPELPKKSFLSRRSE